MIANRDRRSFDNAIGSARKSQSLRVRGTDSIFLSGRKDLTIPLLGSSSESFPLVRYGEIKSDFLQETFPRSISVRPRKRYTFKAAGAIDFFNGSGNGFGPDGIADSSDLFGIAGVSGYQGPTGALVGVFLNRQNPVGRATPATLDFRASGLNKNFTQLSPKLGQVFFIGDGLTGSGKGKVQRFTAPKGATRLFFGVADGFLFSEQPGAYEDNDGFYKVTISSL